MQNAVHYNAGRGPPSRICGVYAETCRLLTEPPARLLAPPANGLAAHPLAVARAVRDPPLTAAFQRVGRLPWPPHAGHHQTAPADLG